METQKIYFLTYADENYRERQDKLYRTALESGQFDEVFAMTKEFAKRQWPEFYAENNDILSQQRGSGYWLWKPHTILEYMKALNDGDIILYADCGDKLAETEGLRDTLIDIMKDKDVYFTDGAFRHGDWTKRDCFVYMNADDEKYHNAIQLEAGIIVVKVGEQALSIVWEWLHNCLDSDKLTDSPNMCALPNLDGFKDHRHDQSILTNLKIRYNLPSGNLLRRYIHCNQNA